MLGDLAKCGTAGFEPATPLNPPFRCTTELGGPYFLQRKQFHQLYQTAVTGCCAGN